MPFLAHEYIRVTAPLSVTPLLLSVMRVFQEQPPPPPLVTVCHTALTFPHVPFISRSRVLYKQCAFQLKTTFRLCNSAVRSREPSRLCLYYLALSLRCLALDVFNPPILLKLLLLQLPLHKTVLNFVVVQSPDQLQLM